jgi:hypothetical protein
MGFSPTKQNNSIALNGYIIDLGHDYYFQPCPDSNIPVLEALKSRNSFLLNFDYHEGSIYIDDIRYMNEGSRKLYAMAHNNHTADTYTDSFSYFFCKLNLVKYGCRNEIPANITLTQDQKSFEIGCLSFNHFIVGTLDPRDRRQYLDSFKRRYNYFPDWTTKSDTISKQ